MASDWFRCFGSFRLLRLLWPSVPLTKTLLSVARHLADQDCFAPHFDFFGWHLASTTTSATAILVAMGQVISTVTSLPGGLIDTVGTAACMQLASCLPANRTELADCSSELFRTVPQDEKQTRATDCSCWAELCFRSHRRCVCLQKFFGNITRRKTVLLLSQVVGIPLAVVYLFQVSVTAWRPILSLRIAAETSPFLKPARERTVLVRLCFPH